MSDTAFREAVARFATELTRNFGVGIPASPEDQLKGPVKQLLEEAGRVLGLTVDSRTEARLSNIAARPDIGVATGGIPLPVGYIELKGPEKTARAEKLKGADRKQWERFKDLPNLIYTTGSQWLLYRLGKPVRPAIQFSGDATADGAGAATAEQADELRELLWDFLTWDLESPRSPRQLAELLAPICRLLRGDVLEALRDPSSSLNRLAVEWRDLLFPDADDAQFADAYAQTVTYALVLVRLSGERDLSRDRAVTALRARHGVLAQALGLLEVDQVREELALGIDLLERVVTAVDPTALRHRGEDPWLYFYEHFLAAYDPRLRKNRGVYYTPVPVVEAQIWLISDLLRNRFGKQLAFADEGVKVLDPAAGTGTYPLAVITHGLDLVSEVLGKGAVPGSASGLANNVHAFEILVGPYAVAHLRLTREVEEQGGQLPSDGVHAYLTDTLESPKAAAPHQPRLFYEVLAREHSRALAVKSETPILVCLGNPPYDRQQIDPEHEEQEKRKGGWIRFGEDGVDGSGILRDFLQPAHATGASKHVKNLYNDYVYFWRWALWKVFEAESSAGPGVVSFITASSYLRGPGFVGMRQVMRKTLDELWIIDLEGDNLGARKSENVFAIQTPVAIAVGVRRGQARPETPATVHHARISGSQEEKLEALKLIEGFDSQVLHWRECPAGWQDPFLPRGDGDYWSWPLLTDLFPWQHSGVQMKRTWPIGETQEVLERRWRALLESADRGSPFRETGFRKTDKQYPSLTSAERHEAINDLPADAPVPSVQPYAFRSFDRQWVIADARFGDRMRPPLWRVHSERQVYLTSLLTEVLGEGPAATAAANVPDLHHFRGSFGGANVIPLWRDSSGGQPNVTHGLLEALGSEHSRTVAPEDLLAYCYAILATPRFVDSHWDELTIPGPRIPITKSTDLFGRAAGLGRRLVWLHTFGERFAPDDERRGHVPRGSAKNTKPIPQTHEGYPEDFAYDEQTRTLRVGEGEFRPVSPEVWSFSVSGLEVVPSWLRYRRRTGAGRKSSTLDEVRPERWESSMTMELLELLWTLEATIDLLPELDALLEGILASELLTADDLPVPSDAERDPPISGSRHQEDLLREIENTETP